MFVLAELQYIIRVEPRRFGKDMKKEITDELNRKFANKVCVYTTVDTHVVCGTTLSIDRPAGAAQRGPVYSTV